MSEPKDNTLKAVMEEIEEKTTQKIKNSYVVSEAIKFGSEPSVPYHLKKDIINKGKTGVSNIMKEGDKEFKQKMGRNMTYSEMRSMMG
jgi:hypothetical protein